MWKLKRAFASLPFSGIMSIHSWGISEYRYVIIPSYLHCTLPVMYFVIPAQILLSIISREIPFRFILHLLRFQIWGHNCMMYDMRSVYGVDRWHPIHFISLAKEQ